MERAIETPEVVRGHGEASTHFDTGVRSSPHHLRERHLRIAGQPVHLRVLGPEFAKEVAAPFEHLDGNGAMERVPSLRIDVWHEEEHGISPERDPGIVSSLGPYGTMTASKDGRFVAEHRPHSAVWLDRQAGHIVAWFSSSERRQLDERARPFHRMLAVAMSDRGVQFAHAGLVAAEGKGALLVGRGGSGKSTSALACLIEGMDFLGDDFVGVSAEDSRHVGHSLYRSAVLGLDHTDQYPMLRAASRPGHHTYETKSLVDLGGLEAGRFIPEVEIRAILLPRIVGTADTHVRAASARDSLVAIAPSSLLLVPGAHTRALERLAALTTEVPSFWLELGRDLGGIAPRVHELLATA